MPVARRGLRWPWEPFIWSAIGLALTGGFTVGAALFGALALGFPAGLWWFAHAQLHGHVQLFGWAGMLVLGVALHFLPRLRGAPLAFPRLVPIILGLLLTGLVIRTLVQPSVGMTRGVLFDVTVRGSFVISGVLELLGISLVLVLLVATIRSGPPIRQRQGFWSSLSFFVIALGALWLASLVNLVALVDTVIEGVPLVPPVLDSVVIDLALYGFLLPVAFGMSIRTFPLFYRLQFPSMRLLQLSLAALLVGLVAEIAGSAAVLPAAFSLGRILQALSLVGATAGLRLFERRRTLPRRAVQPLREPAQLHAVSAYVWALVAAVFLLSIGLAGLGAEVPAAALDAPRHALGAGFVTLLILGVGAQLLPSFASKTIASQRLVWATLVLGNAAALLRVVPLVLPEPSRVALTLAGLAGMAAVTSFGINMWMSVRRRGHGPG